MEKPMQRKNPVGKTNGLPKKKERNYHLPNHNLIYSREELEALLTDRQKNFCREYAIHWNATKAYEIVYLSKNDDIASVHGHRMIYNPKIKQYIEWIRKDYEALCGVTKARNIAEYKKIGYSNVCDLYNDWITLKEFNDVPEHVKACIESIETKTETIVKYMAEYGEKVPVSVQYIKIKFHDKLKALDKLDKLMGYVEMDRQEKCNTFITVGSPLEMIRKAWKLDNVEDANVVE